MRPLMVNNLSEALASMGVDLVGDMPGDAKTTNRLLLANLIQQRIALAFSGIGIDWDYYNVKVDIGARATKICDVMQGDVVVLEIVNVDWPQACPVFLGMNSSVQPGMTTGMEFDPVTISLGVNDAIDFDEGGAALSCTLTAGTYTNPDTLATHVQTQIMAAAGVVNTHTFTWHDSVMKFKWFSNATFNTRFLTGANNATTACTALGFTKEDDLVVTAPFWTASDNTVQKTVVKEDQYGHHGFIMNSGEENSFKVCLTSPLWAVLPTDHEYPVPLSIRRFRVLSRNR